MLETLATAISNPTIDKETTTKVRAALLEKVKEFEADPAYVADRAVAERLFGSFPYGRPLYGTPGSLATIDFADLIQAKQRFLTADNATVTISGNFDRALAFRAARRFFGSWLKADKTTPSTFRQPDEPAVIVMSLPSAKGSAARFAFRGVARSDKDLGASLVFAKVLQKRLSLHAGHEAEVSVRNEYRTLPGSIVISVPASMAAAREAVIKAIADTITDREFAAAKSAAQSEWTMREPTSFWLDADTYRIAKVETDVRLIDDVTLPAVDAYAQMARNLPLVSIVISAQPNQP